MSQIFFSAGTLGFYDRDVHPVMPGDAVPVTPQTYRALMDAQAEGRRIAADGDGMPIATDPPAPDPAATLAAWRASATVTRFQARAALMQSGLLADVELAVGAAEDPFIQLAWAESVEFPRNSPTIAALAAAIGLTDVQVDQLFITASQISA